MTRAAAEFVAGTIRPEIRALGAYPVAKADGMIKLDAMENPFSLPEAVRSKLAEALTSVPINRYPDGGAEALKESLRTALAVPSDLGLIVGNGSDELIQLVVSAVAKPGASLLVPEPSFVMYRLCSLYAGLRYVSVPLKPTFALDMDAMRAAIERERPSLVFLAYPNNPTGNLWPAAEIEEILRLAPGLVVVDEAYHAYADASFLSRVGAMPNLMVVRTLSKIGMAGLRLGYGVATPEWTTELNKLRPPYNVNALTQAAVPILLSETALYADQVAKIKAERFRLNEVLASMPGIETYPSETNFVLARFPDATHTYAHLKAAGILVKNMHGSHPLLENCLRITVGSSMEMDALIEALQTIR